MRWPILPGNPSFIHSVLRALQLLMIDHRPWTALALAGLLCTASLQAQEGADSGAAKKPPASEDTTGTGAASSFGAPAAPPTAPGPPSAAPAQPEVSPSPFGPPPTQGGTQGAAGAPSSAGPGTSGTGLPPESVSWHLRREWPHPGGHPKSPDPRHPWSIDRIRHGAPPVPYAPRRKRSRPSYGPSPTGRAPAFLVTPRSPSPAFGTRPPFRSGLMTTCSRRRQILRAPPK